MTTEFDDELLSAVLDGEADPDLVAAVYANPDAVGRLRSLEAAAALVATPVPPATPERRASSIAAALAAAQPAPEVTSLSVAREERAEQTRRRGGVNWLAVAAAFAIVLLAVPIVLSITRGGSADSVETATDAVADSADTVDASDEGADAGSLAAESAMADDAESADGSSAADERMDEDAMEDAVEEEAMEEADDAMEEDAMEAEEAMDEPTAVTSTTAANLQLGEPFPTNSLLSLQEAIDNGIIEPVLRSTDPELLDVVSPACLPADIDETVERFALVELGEFAPPPQLVVVQFNDDGILIFDAEDCTPVG